MGRYYCRKKKDTIPKGKVNAYCLPHGCPNLETRAKVRGKEKMIIITT